MTQGFTLLIFRWAKIQHFWIDMLYNTTSPEELQRKPLNCEFLSCFIILLFHIYIYIYIYIYIHVHMVIEKYLPIL